MIREKAAPGPGRTIPALSLALRTAPRVLSLLQAATLVAMTAMVATRGWQHHLGLGFALTIVATALWLPELTKPGARRWWFWYVAGIFVYTLLRSLADETNIAVQTAYPIRFDNALFSGHNPTLALQRLFFNHERVSLVDWAAVLMHWSFFLTPHAAAVLVFIKYRPLFPRFAFAMLLTWYSGLVLFFLVPTAPPWLAGNSGALPGTFRVMDFVGGQLSQGAYSNVAATFGEPNSVAAMPSLHMAITFVMVFWAFGHGRSLGIAASCYAGAMAFSLLYLGEHYIADMFAGVVLAFLASLAAARWVPLRVSTSKRASRNLKQAID